jgi:hypothetical protein
MSRGRRRGHRGDSLVEIEFESADTVLPGREEVPLV